MDFFSIRILIPEKKNRLSRADKEKEVKVASSKNAEKRKRSISEEDHGSSPRRFIKKINDGRMVDTFCWKCHELGDDKICSACPRVYHDNCLLKVGKFTEHAVCPECQLQSVDGTRPSADLTTEMMDKVLVCLIRRLLPATTSKSYGFESNSKGRFRKMNDKIPTNFPELMKWPETKYETCKPVDIGMLIEAIKGGGSYSRTIELFSDVQWIYHNCYKCFGAQSKITKAANKIVKAVKSEILDIEACYECYYRNYNEIELYDSDPFPLICKVPHTLLWVKLRGYPFWPSKCLKVIDGKAHIQFFGTHDKNWVDAGSCYLLSRDNPNPKYVGQKSYKSAIVDLQFYIENFTRERGPYRYANDKVPFFPDASWHWVKEKPQFQLLSPKPKGSRKSMHGRRAIINEDTGGNPYVMNGRYPCLSIPRLQDSIFFQYQANSGINLTSDPVITSLPSYDVQTPDVDEDVIIIEQTSHGASPPDVDDEVIILEQTSDKASRPSTSHEASRPSTSHKASRPSTSHKASRPSTSDVGVQTISHSEHTNNASGSSCNDNENPANESVNTSISNKNCDADLDDALKSMGINKEDLMKMDPETQKLMTEGAHFINESGSVLLNYSNIYHRGLEIISSSMQRIKSMDPLFAEVERRKKEIWRKIKSKPIVAKIIMGNIKRARLEMIKNFELEKKHQELELENIEKVIQFCSKEHELLVKQIKRQHENRQNKKIQTIESFSGYSEMPNDIEEAAVGEINDDIEEAAVGRINGDIEEAAVGRINGDIEEVAVGRINGDIEEAAVGRINSDIEEAAVGRINSDIAEAAVGRINGVIEAFMGRNDPELATDVWELGRDKANPQEFVTAVDSSDLEEFGFSDEFLLELWGAITDAKSGRLRIAFYRKPM